VSDRWDIMSVDSKRKLILKNLLHVNTPTDRSRPQNGMVVQVTAELWPSSARPRTRGHAASLPYQRQIQRAIGHIYNLGSAPPTPKLQVSEQDQVHSLPEFIPSKVLLRYRR